LLEAERPVSDVRGVTVTLLFERDDLPALGEHRQHVAERRLDRIATAVQQHQWRLSRIGRAVDFVIQLEAIDGRISGLGGRGGVHSVVEKDRENGDDDEWFHVSASAAQWEVAGRARSSKSFPPIQH